jgi:hypothetical protein
VKARVDGVGHGAYFLLLATAILALQKKILLVKKTAVVKSAALLVEYDLCNLLFYPNAFGFW